MTRLIADGGSTKTEWSLRRDDNTETGRFITPGMNPSLMSKAELMAGLERAVAQHQAMLGATEIEYYGAGCTPYGQQVMRECLSVAMPHAESIIVGSDIIGAAKALCGHEEGIACILGTGANSCLWDGSQIAMQTPSLGYILGDEGSGAVLGRRFLNALYKGQLGDDIRRDFEAEHRVDMMGVIGHVYRSPQPNRWLASLSPFIRRHTADPRVRAIVEDNFRQFLSRNIVPYQRPELRVSFVGSIAYYYQDILRETIAAEGLQAGDILLTPFSSQIIEHH
ncbi:MAG: ATPase [Prevotella sp.]